MPKIHASCPHFTVADLGAALDYYVDALGFERPPLWGDPPRFAMPRRDGFIVMLAESPNGPKPQGDGYWDAYFWCDDVQALYEEFRSGNAMVSQAPIDRPLYGMREIELRDADGYVLAFGQDIEGA